MSGGTLTKHICNFVTFNYLFIMVRQKDGNLYNGKNSIIHNQGNHQVFTLRSLLLWQTASLKGTG